MSDTMSTASSDIELDNSITEDINNLVDSCHELHANIIEADKLLNNIKDRINISDTIYIIHNGVQMDFYDLLESLHTEALLNIEEGLHNSFEDTLLNSIDKLV
jgi:hypothetical protein